MTTTPKEIVLRPWNTQVPSIQKICSLLRIWHAYIDTSPMGAGKTIVTLAICIIFKLHLIVVAPKSLLSMWKKYATEYNVNLIYSMTYAKLAGRSASGCNHPLIDRVGNKFLATKTLQQYIRRGTLFVFDEMHNLKNVNTAQLNAAHCIIKEIVKLNCSSRIALLSATPCDKKVHVISIFKLLGIMSYDKPYNYNKSTHKYELLGIAEVLNYCSTIDKITTQIIYGGVDITRHNCISIAYNLYTDVIKPKLSTFMPKPKIDAKLDAKNGYYKMNAKDVKTIQQGVADLSAAVKYVDGEIMKGGLPSWGDITSALMKIEEGKRDTMVRLTKEKLNTNTNGKVVLYVWYIASINYIHEKLAEFSPLVMCGKTSIKERDQIINLFQQDDSQYRILISNTKVGGIGISLDDITGTKPRTMLMIPSYNFIDMYQATGRIYRGTTKSDATIRFIYCKQYPNETSILNAIARKTEVMKSIINTTEDMIFPGDYEKYIEA